MTDATNKLLLRLHVEAVWSVRVPTIEQKEIELLPDSLHPDWILCIADIPGERIYIWRPDISIEARQIIQQQANDALTSTSTTSSIHREIAFALTATPRIDLSAASGIARPLSHDDRQVVDEFEEGEVNYYFQPEVRPLIGVIVDDRLVCIAHSSRRTQEACELGIDTLPDTRCKGYALAATVLWSHMVTQEGIVPIYSAFTDNTPSLHLAEAAGYRPFAQIATFNTKWL